MYKEGSDINKVKWTGRWVLASAMVKAGFLKYNPDTHHDVETMENSKYIWIFKPQIKRLLFTEGRNIPDGDAMMPKLLFMASNKTLSVFALKSGDQLYRAPFHNTSSNGIVCQGSARANKRSWVYRDVMDYWEDIFFNSKFSHASGGNPIKGDIDEFWRKAIETKSKKFDSSCLIKMDKKIQDLF